MLFNEIIGKHVRLSQRITFTQNKEKPTSLESNSHSMIPLPLQKIKIKIPKYLPLRKQKKHKLILLLCIEKKKHIDDHINCYIA